MVDISKYTSDRFNKVSIVVPVINEVSLLRTTIEVVEKDCAHDVQEYIIVVCQKTTPESMALCKEYHQQNPERFKLYHQNKPFLGNAIHEGFLQASASHVITMASDCETNPDDVKHLIEKAKQHPEAMITTSRWREESTFENYGLLKKVLNYGFQKMLQILYLTRFTDLTFCFRLMPTKLAQAIDWQGEKHPFLLETFLKPLRLGVKIIEIPTSWHPRSEGESQNSLFTMFSYTKWAFVWRFETVRRWIK